MRNTFIIVFRIMVIVLFVCLARKCELAGNYTLAFWLCLMAYDVNNDLKSGLYIKNKGEERDGKEV